MEWELPAVGCCTVVATVEGSSIISSSTSSASPHSSKSSPIKQSKSSSKASSTIVLPLGSISSTSNSEPVVVGGWTYDSQEMGSCSENEGDEIVDTVCGEVRAGGEESRLCNSCSWERSSFLQKNKHSQLWRRVIFNYLPLCQFPLNVCGCCAK